MTTSLYACPVCQLPLTTQEKSWVCEQNHRFDQHKKGYVNLLLAQNKRSKTPGDDAEMVNSRRRFLEAQFYLPLADHLAEQCAKTLPADAAVFDAGCGEGYYTARIANRNPKFQMYGLDISKPAIAAACKHKGIQWSVASSTHAPFVDQAFDGIISVFSRVDSDPFDRILKPGGLIALVTPDHDHLMALRDLIYDDVRAYDTAKHSSYFDDRFTLVNETRLEVPLELADNQSIMDLLGMTPHAHRLSASTREQLQMQASLTDTACFKVYWFKKHV
jgi:23S rRNA (guanine745-N1)-methyltransferase